jgi:DNA invertase Pin-like site-specific DNA recombinase
MMGNDDLMRAYASISRMERRERIARQLAVVQAAQKAGLTIRGATIEGVELELGAPEGPAKAVLTPLEAWKAKRDARQA